MKSSPSDLETPVVASRSGWGSIATLCSIVAVTGCSHTQPWIAEDFVLPPIQGREFPAPDALAGRVILVGDAGQPGATEPTLELLRDWVAIHPDQTTTVFLGDNVYPDGVPADERGAEYACAVRALEMQVAAARAGRRTVFVPGNHDWYADDPRQGIFDQQAVIDSITGSEESFRPRDGCVGPVSVEAGSISLIVFDPSPWLKDFPHVADCANGNREVFLTQLNQALIDAEGGPVVVANHYPLRTHGPHGGFYDWQDHLFPATRLNSALWVPLPGVGTLIQLGRRYVYGSNMDVFSSEQRDLRGALEGVLKRHRPLVFAAGHDHSLQVMDGGGASVLHVVSGAGSESKLSAVGHGDDTLFSHLHAGFVVVDALVNGRTVVRVVEPDEHAPEVIPFQVWLRHDGTIMTPD